MGVSESHLRLVDELEAYIKKEYTSYHGLIIYKDSPSSTQAVPKIGNAVPDVLGRSFDPELTVVGEAKTIDDVERDHSIKQYTEYLKFCSAGENRKLVFAVPWTETATLNNLIFYLKRQLGITNVYPYIIPLLNG